MPGRRLLWPIALAAIALIYAFPLQPVGCNQTAHYALVESLAQGTPRIDRFHNQTCDTAYVGGHYYAAKAPGLALFAVPWFLALKALGAVPKNPQLDRPFPAAMLALPRRALWQVGLFATVLPALMLVALIRRTVEEIEPGRGLVAAVTIGLGTLLLPFATVLFSHVLGALLAFAAFCLLFARRSPVLAGLLAGLGVTTDFPIALAAIALALYAWPKALRFAGGLTAGIVPLLAYNVWAFGSPFRLSYANAVLVPGRTGHDKLGANGSGFFGIGVPSLRAAAELLFSPRGLLVLTPVLACSAAGLAVLWRRGFRRESALAGAIAAAFLVYNAGYYLPFGGYVPGPRFLLATIPFLALGLGTAYSRWPVPTAALAAFSIGAMTVATAAEPLLGTDDTHSWIRRWQNGDFAQTVATLRGHGHSWVAISPFLAAVAVAVVIAATRLPWAPPSARSVAAVVAWLVVFASAPDLLHTDRVQHQSFGLVALILLLAAIGATLATPRVAGLLAGVPLVFLALPGFAAHTKHALLVAAAVLAASGTVSAVSYVRGRTSTHVAV